MLVAAAGLLAFAGAASAMDQIVRWTRVEGLGAADAAAIYVGPFGASRGRTVGDGSVMLNLNTGFLSFTVRGLANGKQYDNGPLGAPYLPPNDEAEPFIGTVVCDSTERWGTITYVDTEPVSFDADGNGKFVGFVAVPAACRERPEETVFLLRHFGFNWKFVAYGAGRTIR
jgi:hypothetical protein